jgi:uncharacterized protein YqeY
MLYYNISMISDTIRTQIQDAMKARDELRVSTLKMLSSALMYAKIAKMGDLTEEEELAVVRKEVKQRNDSVEQYRKGNAEDKAAKEESEIVLLKEFLPAEMDDSQLSDLVTKAIEEIKPEGLKDMGRVIALVKEKSEGRADGGKIAQLVKEKLNP